MLQVDNEEMLIAHVDGNLVKNLTVDNKVLVYEETGKDLNSAYNKFIDGGTLNGNTWELPAGVSGSLISKGILLNETIQLHYAYEAYAAGKDIAIKLVLRIPGDEQIGYVLFYPRFGYLNVAYVNIEMEGDNLEYTTLGDRGSGFSAGGNKEQYHTFRIFYEDGAYKFQTEYDTFVLAYRGANAGPVYLQIHAVTSSDTSYYRARKVFINAGTANHYVRGYKQEI